jgi:hypothetical protein
VCLPPARVVDDQPPHHPRRIAHEAVAIRERCTGAAGDVQVGFVQQRGCADGHAGAAPGQLAPRHAVQLVVERRKQLVSRAAVALLSGDNECREL